MNRSRLGLKVLVAALLTTVTVGAFAQPVHKRHHRHHHHHMVHHQTHHVDHGVRR